jgi:hypothetical protein
MYIYHVHSERQQQNTLTHTVSKAHMHRAAVVGIVGISGRWTRSHRRTAQYNPMGWLGRVG